MFYLVLKNSLNYCCKKNRCCVLKVWGNIWFINSCFKVVKKLGKIKNIYNYG